jgi:hypothetical protein
MATSSTPMVGCLAPRGTNPTCHGITGSGFSLRTIQGRYALNSDFSVSLSGILLGPDIQVCTTRTATDPGNTSQLNTLPNIGVLLGNKDHATYHLANTGAGFHQFVKLRAIAANAGADFDLFVKCSAPSANETDFTWASRSTSNDEFIDTGAGCGGDFLFVTVESFSGSGSFELITGTHRADSHTPLLRAGTNFVANTTQINQFKAQLAQGAREFFIATEGQQSIERIDFFNSGTCGSCGGNFCDICFSNSTTIRSNSPVCNVPTGSQVTIAQASWGSADVLAHELGHYMFCASDEYKDACNNNSAIACTTANPPAPTAACIAGGGTSCLSFPSCAHSLMANTSVNHHQYCLAGDHAADGVTGVTGPASSVFTNAVTRGKSVNCTQKTSNNADTLHDFSGKIGFVP